MTTYNNLKKIIPPDQALANEALSRSLRQVKDIFNTDLPTLSEAVSALESNKDLPLINALTQPVPDSIRNYYANTFATGTGPGNIITTDDLIGTAGGVTHNSQLPVVIDVIGNLSALGALNSLTGNGGTPSSSTNGVYTVMNYCLGNAYTSDDGFGNYTITIPAPLPGAGTYGPDSAFGNVIDSAFSALISAGNSAIANIATNYSTQAQISNEATNAMANQLALNQDNCIRAGLDIANIVMDIANADLQSNSTSTVLQLTTRLQDIGLDVSAGGQAQFFELVANTSTLSGQAVVATMREGRNIQALNSVGIRLDTQLLDTNPNPQVANNLSSGQYTVAEAQGNIII